MVKKIFEYFNTDRPATWKDMLLLLFIGFVSLSLMFGLLSILPPGPCADLEKLTIEERRICEERDIILPPGRSLWG